MATFITALIIFGLLFLALCKVLHTKGCSCGCESCGSHCCSSVKEKNKKTNKVLTDKTSFRKEQKRIL